MRRGDLSLMQLFWLGVTSMFPTSILLVAGDLIRLVGRHADWSPLAFAVPIGGLAWLLGALAARNGDPFAALMDAAGPWLARPAFAVLALGVGFYLVPIVREFGEMAASTFTAGTVPLPLLIVMGLVPAIALAWLGPVVTARLAALAAPVLIAVYAAVLAVSVPFLHVIWTLPLLPQNSAFLNGGAMRVCGALLGEAALGALLVGRLPPATRRFGGAVLAAAVALTACLTAVGLWAMVADFGPRFAAATAVPFIAMAKEVHYSMLIRHVEAFVIPIEVLGSAIKLAIFLWLWTYTAASAVGGGRDWLLGLGALGAGWLGVALFANAPALARWIDVVVPAAALLTVGPGLLVMVAVPALAGRRPPR